MVVDDVEAAGVQQGSKPLGVHDRAPCLLHYERRRDSERALQRDNLYSVVRRLFNRQSRVAQGREGVQIVDDGDRVAAPDELTRKSLDSDRVPAYRERRIKRGDEAELQNIYVAGGRVLQVCRGASV